MARRAPWEDVVNADMEPRARRRAGRRPRLLAGLAAIGVGTFIAAFYVPLFHAHRALSREYGALAEQSESVKAAWLRTQAELTNVREDRDGLRQQRDVRDGAAAAAKTRADRLGKELAVSLEKSVKKGAVNALTKDGMVLLMFDPAFVFTPQGSVVSAGGRAALCEAARVAGKTALIHVHDFLMEGATVPAVFAERYPSVWIFTAARAAGVAQALEDNCGVAASALHASGDANQDRFGPALGPAKGERVVLEITPPR